MRIAYYLCYINKLRACHFRVSVQADIEDLKVEHLVHTRQRIDVPLKSNALFSKICDLCSQKKAYQTGKYSCQYYQVKKNSYTRER